MRKITLLLVIFAFASVSAAGQNVVSEILKRMGAHGKALKSLNADITITKFSVQSGGTYTKEGVIKFLPGKNSYPLRIDSTKPVAESFVIINNQYLLYQPNPSEIYQPNPKTAYTGGITDSQKNTFMIFSILSKGIFKAAYTEILYLGQEKVNGTPVWHLEFKPKTTNEYKILELWVDGNGMPIQSKVIENNGDWTSTLLGKLNKNLKMKTTDFQIDLPKGIKIIKN